PAVRRAMQHTIVRKPAINGCIDRGCPRIDIERRTPRRLARRDSARDIYLILHRTRLAAVTHAICTRGGIRATRHENDARAGIALRARVERKLDVVTDIDRDAPEIRIEYLQHITGFDDARNAFKSCQT